MSTDHNFWRERRAEAESNCCPSADQHNALPLGQVQPTPRIRLKVKQTLWFWLSINAMPCENCLLEKTCHGHSYIRLAVPFCEFCTYKQCLVMSNTAQPPFHRLDLSSLCSFEPGLSSTTAKHRPTCTETAVKANHYNNKCVTVCQLLFCFFWLFSILPLCFYFYFVSLLPTFSRK